MSQITAFLLMYHRYEHLHLVRTGVNKSQNLLVWAI
jgi:hypothetical protein